MTCKDELLLEVADLFFLSIDSGISDEQFVKLETLLQDNPLAREYYFDLLLTTIGLNETEGILSLAERGLLLGDVGSPLWQILAETEKTSPEIPVKKPIEKSVEPELTKTEKPGRKISRFSIFTLALSSAAILLFMVMLLIPSVRPVVGVLTDSINAEWINTKDIPVNGDTLSQGEITLAKGFAEITFDDGAVVVIEAPAVIKLESPKSMFLTSGKISAVVSEYATGFTVNTLSASIVDLGTEFGVSVEDDSSCSLYMFKGLANLIAGQKGQKRTTQRVIANEAKSVDLAGVVKNIKLRKKSFVRQINSEKGFILRGDTLSLADIVGGGDGTGNGTVGQGVDLNNGGVAAIDRNRIVSYYKSFSVVNTSPFIDSVFIPDGGIDREVTINSGGMKFADFPNTDGWTTDNIYYQGETIYYAMGKGGKSCLPVIDGKQYGNERNPAIFMHSNAGITFDLAAIRSFIGSSITISGFNALCGLPDGIEKDTEFGTANLDLWILVDGQERFKKMHVQSGSALEQINLPLTDNDRFLTLVVTDGGDGINMDIVLFTEPVLELSSK
ncbi:MAG: NPCBM/NEW2 domain-containing protein [Anaerolineae bacterium]|nr:NPCBM/NEW2 domain-containing protein [Anaerolineae bacterium]